MGLPEKLSWRTLVAAGVAAAFVASAPVVVHGQAAPTTAPAAAGDAPVPMEFPAEGVELRTLVDIVTKRLKIPIMYEAEQLANKRVIIRVPVNVPESALLGILQSTLKMKQLALVDADQPGWKQIVPATNLAAVARPLAPGETAGPAVVVTQVFTLKHVEPGRVIESLKSFLTPAGPNGVAGNVQILPGQRAIIVSDYQSTITHVAEILNLLDTEGSQPEVRFVPLKQAEAGQLVPLLTQLLAAKEAGGAPSPAAPAGGAGGSGGVMLAPDERLNQIIVVAPPARMAEVLKLIEGLDRAAELSTKVYRLKSVSPERIDKLMKSLLGSGAKRTYQSTVDRDSQTLVVSATPDVHTQLEGLVKELDVYVPETESPIRFYKLKNTKASDVLATISGLYGQSEGQTGQLQFDSTTGEPVPTTTTPGTTPGAATGTTTGGATGMTQAQPRQVRTVNGMPLGDMPPNNTVGSGGNLSSLQRPLGDTTNVLGVSSGSRFGYNQSRAASGDLLGEGTATLAVHAPNATVAADPNTNSIIVIAPPAVQTTYAELIKRLDERRPQVQIECTIVTLDTSDGYSLAVDVAKVGGFGNSTLITFSSFGVSTLAPKTGALTPVAAQGGTAALLSPDIANAVVRALSTHSRARLVSAPQILVNDNGKGKLQSVAQQPFAEILDTASTQSRTGLGGQAEAGTTISVEPHISQDDYLQLAYSVELSAFTGAAQSGLPPPSQKNTVDSTVTIPDGYTIVVGGLQQKNFQHVLNSIPVIENIPLVNLLFGSRSTQRQDTTLFVFIRPVILRDDKFMDLKYLSERRTGQVGLPSQYPRSEPIPIK